MTTRNALMGRFAVDYKWLFGESPSTTLNASRRSIAKTLMGSLLER
jgi:hypothetical protein